MKQIEKLGVAERQVTLPNGNINMENLLIKKNCTT